MIYCQAERLVAEKKHNAINASMIFRQKKYNNKLITGPEERELSICVYASHGTGITVA